MCYLLTSFPMGRVLIILLSPLVAYSGFFYARAIGIGDEGFFNVYGPLGFVILANLAFLSLAFLSFARWKKNEAVSFGPLTILLLAVLLGDFFVARAWW